MNQKPGVPFMVAAPRTYLPVRSGTGCAISLGGVSDLGAESRPTRTFDQVCHMLRSVELQRTHLWPYSATAVRSMLGREVVRMRVSIRAMGAVPVVAAVLALGVSGCGRSDDQLDTSEPWDLVWISDSIGAGVAEAWADGIEESEGVEVRVHSHIIGFLTIGNAQKLISNEATVRDELAEAEIIVVYGNAAATAPNDLDTCARSGADPRDPPPRYTSADLALYGDAFRDIFDTVFDLRADQPTVIRTYDFFSGPLADWREAGIEPECTAGWEAQADAIHEAANEYGVLTASFYDDFNGINHDEDPRKKGYIAADGWHQSQDAGVSAQVEVLHALGYDPIIP